MMKLTVFLAFMLGMTASYAQTDLTSKITNPSFEKGTEGWTLNDLNAQGNNAFTLKSGNTYLEKWVGGDSPVGSARLSQTLTDLPPGTYELTAAAQNIKESNAKADQTGAWIFAGTEKTAVTVVATYSVRFTFVLDPVTIGFEAVNASGNWIAVDNFRLKRIDEATEAVRAALTDIVNAARELYGDASGVGVAAFDNALKQAEAVLAQTNATSDAMITQAKAVKEAEEAYRLANASEQLPYDMTSKIVNASFEDGWNGWTQSGMQLQGNDSFALKEGSTYVERWTGRGGLVGDGSVTQTVKGLPCGRYRLTVAGQNIQEDSPNTTKTGAWIVADNQRTAVGRRAEYSVTFTVVTGDAVIGFVAEGAKGNWLACDNFRLEYLGADAEGEQGEMTARIEAAEALLSEKMNAEVLSQLQGAIAAAKAVSGSDMATTAAALRKATEDAQSSIDAYKALLKAIEDATAICATGRGNDRAIFQGVIDGSQTLYNSDTAQNDDMSAKIMALESATFVYQLANATGTVPKVTTDPRYARGAIAAFGRMSVSGISSSQIKEKGFCWSTEPNPTVLDNRTTNYLSQNGEIYVMDMEPATVYYIRAYAMTKSYAVGYGDVIKISTLPMGDVSYTYYNNDGGDFHNNKNTNALSEVCWYWSNYTSIRGFHVTANYSSGTPTADCGYGGNMRIGPNTGQRTGTMMHEMNHGIGGGTIDVWGGWNESFLRTSVNGDWAGERANAVLRFWENREDLVITAAYDGAHWGFRTLDGAYSQDNNWLNKYAFNGSHLEAGNWAGPQNWNDTQIVYIGNSLINQAMCEDGLVPVNYWSGGFCLPAYVFEQDDQKKYYIKCESAEHGLYDSFLTEGHSGKLTWKTMGSEEVSENDSTAWYVSFDAKTQYYTFCNAATKHLISYSNGFKTALRTNPSAADKFHLIRGRNDLEIGDMKLRGYWIIHPEQSNTPSTMTASTYGNVTSASLDLYDRASQQRWVFLTADQLDEFESGTVDAAKDELLAYINQLKKLKRVPHTEDVEGADDTMADQIAALESGARTATTATEVNGLLDDARACGVEFLSSVSPSDITKPFDLTFMVKNAAISSSDGWNGDPAYAESCCEFFQRIFDFNQTVTGLPKGNFKLMAQAFQRPGQYDAAYNAYARGSNQVNAVLYAGNKTQKIQHIGEGAQNRKVHDDDVQVGSPAVFIPNTMASAAAYFRKKYYDNEVWAATSKKNASLKIGIRGTVTNDGYWTICDNFRLYFYGSLTKEFVNDIDELQGNDLAGTESVENDAIYDLNGRLIRQGTDLKGLPKGLYIVRGKKVLIK
ncbi:MAG: T9SS type A sorting domain-containing protein [Bacteroidaceae bacterium]|nr:T9SS type A sorting domain-containing protein [Bacteroidaceae bacterium]